MSRITSLRRKLALFESVGRQELAEIGHYRFRFSDQRFDRVGSRVSLHVEDIHGLKYPKQSCPAYFNERQMREYWRSFVSKLCEPPVFDVLEEAG
ncbi:hypothetical protein Dxin01_00086 [Deinococcus xinjiangensis]|uniref:Uncharacterized protein n=1 Tax=Deinococcus xinjiangensis TaxID=457454 RepID=A0ABP9V779_9DEIO